jgi:hypothetical protein
MVLLFQGADGVSESGPFKLFRRLLQRSVAALVTVGAEGG